MEWSDELCLRLLEHYKAFPILWDPKNVNYYRKTAKENAWKKISTLMTCSVDVCHNKMLSLLSSYRREKAKELKTKQTDKRSPEGYKSRWFAYESLAFLEHRDKPRKRKIKIECKDLDFKTQNTKTARVAKTKNQQNVEEECRQRKIDRNENGDETQENAKSSIDNNSDEIQTFLSFVGAKMKNYSRQTQNTLQHAMFDLIMNADNGNFDYPQPVSGSYSSGYPSSPSYPNSATPEASSYDE